LQLSCTCASEFAPEGSKWRLSSKQVGGIEILFVIHLPGPRGISLCYSCPSRASSQCFYLASGASRSQHRLSSFLLTAHGSRSCNAPGCTNTNITSGEGCINGHRNYVNIVKRKVNRWTQIHGQLQEMFLRESWNSLQTSSCARSRALTSRLLG